MQVDTMQVDAMQTEPKPGNVFSPPARINLVRSDSNRSIVSELTQYTGMPPLLQDRRMMTTSEASTCAPPLPGNRPPSKDAVRRAISQSAAKPPSNKSILGQNSSREAKGAIARYGSQSTIGGTGKKNQLPDQNRIPRHPGRQEQQQEKQLKQEQQQQQDLQQHTESEQQQRQPLQKQQQEQEHQQQQQQQPRQQQQEQGQQQEQQEHQQPQELQLQLHSQQQRPRRRRQTTQSPESINQSEKEGKRKTKEKKKTKSRNKLKKKTTSDAVKYIDKWLSDDGQNEDFGMTTEGKEGNVNVSEDAKSGSQVNDAASAEDTSEFINNIKDRLAAAKSGGNTDKIPTKDDLITEGETKQEESSLPGSLRSEDEDHLSNRSVKDLRRILNDYGIDTSTLIEKSEFINCIKEQQATTKSVNDKDAGEEAKDSTTDNRAMESGASMKGSEEEHLSSLTVKELRKILTEYDIDTSTLIEKSEFINKIKERRAAANSVNIESSGETKSAEAQSTVSTSNSIPPREEEDLKSPNELTNNDDAEKLSKCTVKELRQTLNDYGIDTSQLIEKSEFINKILEIRRQQQQQQQEQQQQRQREQQQQQREREQQQHRQRERQQQRQREQQQQQQQGEQQEQQQREQQEQQQEEEEQNKDPSDGATDSSAAKGKGLDTFFAESQTQQRDTSGGNSIGGYSLEQDASTEGGSHPSRSSERRTSEHSPNPAEGESAERGSSSSRGEPSSSKSQDDLTEGEPPSSIIDGGSAASQDRSINEGASLCSKENDPQRPADNRVHDSSSAGAAGQTTQAVVRVPGFSVTGETDSQFSSPSTQLKVVEATEVCCISHNSFRSFSQHAGINKFDEQDETMNKNEFKRLNKPKGMREKVFGNPRRSAPGDIAASIQRRDVLGWTVKRNPAVTNQWVTAIKVKPGKNDVADTVRKFCADSKHDATELGLAMATPRWSRFDENPICHVCKNKFAMLRRPTHCKNCGVCVCSTCAVTWPAKMIPETFNVRKETQVKVCVACDWLATSFRQALVEGRFKDAVNLYTTGNVNLRTPFCNSSQKEEVIYPIHAAVMGGNLPLLKWLTINHCCPLQDTGNFSSRKSNKKSGPILTSAGRSALGIALADQNMEMICYLVGVMNMSFGDEKDFAGATTLVNFSTKLVHMLPDDFFQPKEVIEDEALKLPSEEEAALAIYS